MKEVTAESIIVLKRPKDYEEEQGCVFELTFSKARGFYGAEAASLLLTLKEKDGTFHWIDQKLVAKTYELVVELYIGGMTQRKDIAQALNITPQAVGKHLRNAERKGDIKKS